MPSTAFGKGRRLDVRLDFIGAGRKPAVPTAFSSITGRSQSGRFQRIPHDCAALRELLVFQR